MTTRVAMLAVAVFATPSCGGSIGERPALIATETGHAELLRAVSTAFNGRTVTIADDALERDSVLSVERREPRDIDGRPLTGRVLERPELFRLVLRGSRCELVRESDGSRSRIAGGGCVAAP